MLCCAPSVALQFVSQVPGECQVMAGLSLTAAKQTDSLSAAIKLAEVFFKMHQHQNKANPQSDRGQLEFVTFKNTFSMYELIFTVQAVLARSYWISFLIGNLAFFPQLSRGV